MEGTDANPVYRERIGWPAWVHGLVVAPVTIALGAAVIAFRRDGWDWNLLPFLAVASIGIFWWFFRYLAVEAGPDGIAFGFVHRRRRVPRAWIRDVQVETYSVSRYMGWGYRIGWKTGDRAYSVPGPGRGVRVAYRDDNGETWSVFVSSERPDELRAKVLGVDAENR